MRYIIPLLIFLLITAFLWKGLSKDPHQLESTLIGKPLPEFQYPNLLKPSEIINNNVFKGHVSLLNIWATWCMTCHIEHSILMDIAHLGEVSVYGLNYKDDVNQAKQWLEKYGNPYEKVISDPKGILSIDLGVYGTPETFVIDKNGIVRYRHIGAISPDDWKEKIEPVIREWSTQNETIF